MSRRATLVPGPDSAIDDAQSPLDDSILVEPTIHPPVPVDADAHPNPADAPEPGETATVAPQPPTRDPFAEVEAVLARARAARGVRDPDPPRPVALPELDRHAERRSDPLAAAEAALEAARAARTAADPERRIRDGLAGLATRRAEAELRRLKAAREDDEE